MNKTRPSKEFPRTTPAEFRRLLKEGETSSFHKFNAHMESEFRAWLTQFFCENPHISHEEYFEELWEVPELAYPQDVEEYIEALYSSKEYLVEYTPVMRFRVDLPEPLAEKVFQAANSQGKSAETIILDAITNQLDLLHSLKKAE